MFLFGFGMASVAKAQQKMSNHCTSQSRNLLPAWTLNSTGDHNIAICTSCPKSPRWCPKASKVRDACVSGLLVGCFLCFCLVLTWLLLQRLNKR